ncbi:MAG: DUF4351 domain-containing protein [Symploca sp. SIO1C4]|uniref:DUF4351 domain-containing protein n=1 Tax=Symploca sp. SIO1C4 TaxID=2607765 RepID=A0A6B3ND20_9CYAN|nr:DUF4351 domain-containing protein [Symploca sp. SIO1C4]NET06261.1 DUF4351 domain-containing protein [Symploca sp. SIO2B6]
MFLWQLEELGEALLNFQEISDLVSWLERQSEDDFN